MNGTRFAALALLLALTLVFAACGEKEEPAKPDVADQPSKPAAGDPAAETPETPPAEAPAKKLWTLNATSLKEYGAAFKDLKENAPAVLRDAGENALTMVKKNDGLSFGNKATAVLETHGITAEQFKHFGSKLWPAVLAVAPEKASQAGGLSGLAGDHATSLQGAADEALKEYTKSVTADDKAFVKANLDEILALLK